MVGKRQASNTPASPVKSKKAKLDGQKSLDVFFASPSKPNQKLFKSSSGVGKGKGKEIDVIDVDAEDDDDVVELKSIKDVSISTKKNVKARRVSPISEDKNNPAKSSSSSAHLNDVIKPKFQSNSNSVTSSPQKATTRVLGAKSIAIPDIITYPDLSQDPLLFSIEECPWPTGTGTPTPYSFLTHAFCLLSQTRSRILLVNIITNTLRCIIAHHPTSLLPTLYLLSNSLTPAFTPVELNIGPSIITKALQSVSGLSSAALRKLYSASGDPGDVAFEAKSSVRTLIPHPPLLVHSLYDSLLKIALSKGNGAAKQKQSIVEKLLVAAKGEESRYLVRTLAQHLRVGAVRTTMLSSLARAFVLTRPPHPTPPPPEGSELFAPPDLVALVEPLPEKKKAGVVDLVREKIKARFLNTESLLKRVFVQHPDYGHIVQAILGFGLENLAEHVPLTVGIPLHPTLGSPTRSLDEIYERLGELPFAAEFKYDGQRAQIHASREGDKYTIKLFSRHLEDMTEKYPDIISLVKSIFEKSEEIHSFIIDAEIVAIDPSTGEVKSFQELSNRPRKDVALQDVKVAVCVFVFDLMYYNGNILLEEPFRSRRSTLRTQFPPFTPNAEDKWTARLDHVESCESEEGREVVEEFFQRSVEARSEGLMIKLLDSGEVVVEDEEAVTASPKKGKGKSNRKPLPATYEPDKRTSAWLKLKKDYVNGLGDSFDLVPIGAWHGMGRKSKWWSPVLLAIWDPRKGMLVAVCKCMSGFTDAFYQAMMDRYQLGSETCSRTPFKEVECDFGGLVPPVYFKPNEVWELRGADITLSPRSVAALGHVSDQRGLSIRFPRFIRVREDKHLENASGPDMLAEMWRKQGASTGKDKRDAGGADEGDLLDVEIDESEQGSDMSSAEDFE